MLDHGDGEVEAAVRKAAEAYCTALHEGDTERMAALFLESSHLYASQDGALIEWPRQTFIDRIGSRKAGRGAPVFEIVSVDVAGPEMAHVRLNVDVPPRRFTDYLNFLLIDGEWRVIAKIFRVADGPAV